MNRPDKNPRGGAGLLFLAGLGLEAIVVLVALRTAAAEALADAWDEVAPTPSDDAAWLPTQAPPIPVDAVPAGGSISETNDTIAAGIEATRTICFDNLAEAPDYESLITFELTIERDGRVSKANVAGATAALRACLESEALAWTMPAPGQQIVVSRSARFEAY